MAQRTLSVVLLCLASAPVAAAIPVHVDARLCLEEGRPLPDGSRLRLTPIGFIGSAPADRRVALRSGRVKLELPAAVWRATLEAPGLWAPPQDIVASHGAEVVSVAVCARSLARLTLGTSLRGTDDPRDVRAVLTSAPDEPAPEPGAHIEQETFACVGSHAGWTCEVPSGRLDVEIRATGFVPNYHFAMDIAPREVVRRPPIAWRRAASVSGEVREQDGSPARLVPVVLTRPESSLPLEAGKEEPAAVRAVTNARGFFQLVGMPPGRYQVLARGRDGVESAVELPVAVNTESRLNVPLVLQAPAAVTIRVSPERPPGEGGTWALTLRRMEFPVAQVAAELRLASRGEWTRANLRPGPYRLELSAPSGRWLVRTIDVQPGEQLIEVDARPRRIAGYARVGEIPVEGRIVWGGQFGAVRVSLPLGEDGRFEGVIPERPAENGPWPIFVEGIRPAVARNVDGVVLPADPSEEMEIVLPGTSLRGTVVDADGRPVPLAVVYVSPEAKAPVEQKKNRDEKGEFRFDGLPPGRYTVSAVGPGNQASDDVAVTLDDERDEARVRLVLRRTQPLVVRIRSPEGRPVPGARVYVLPAQAPNAGAPIGVTDLGGEVTVHVPQQTAEILIAVGAAGYATRMARLRVPTEGASVLDLSRRGGTLRLNLGSQAGEDLMTVLYHGGMALSVPALSGAGLVSGGGPSPDSRSWTLPMMAPGRYTACVVAPGNVSWNDDSSSRLERPRGVPCAAGLLGAEGDLVLRVEG